MYANRLTKIIEVDLRQGHCYLVEQLKFHRGNFCVVRHKEFDEHLVGKLERVNDYHFGLKGSKVEISYRDVTHMSIYVDSWK